MWSSSIGADITGQLILRDAKLTGDDGQGNALVGDLMKVGGGVFLDQQFTAAGAIRLVGADITSELNLSGAKLTGTDNNGNALAGDRLKVGGDAVLDQQFTAAGAIGLVGADISGQLNLSGAKLTGTDNNGNALAGDRLKVGGNAVLGQQFTAAGAIWLVGADISGQLNLRDAKLTGVNGDGNALIGDGLKVGGDAVLDQQFTAAGAIRLVGADISGQLNLSGAKLTGTDNNGNALIGDELKVGEDAVLGQQFTTAGAIRLAGADISGELNLSGAKLTGTDNNGNALIGDGLKVGGNAFLGQQFTAAGAVSITRARIDGSVSLDGAELAEPVALLARGVHVDGQLTWAPRSPVSGLVDLELATVHRLDDDWGLLDDQGVPDAHWPPEEKLRLAGFTYDEFGGENQASCEQRLGWIRRSNRDEADGRPPVFAAQPYEQLARVYRQTGQESDARQVAIVRHTDLRRFGDLTGSQWLGNWLLDKTIKHGYQSLRAVVLLAAVYLVVLLVAWGAQHHDSVIVPAKSIKDIEPVPTAMQCSPGYPCFYPAGYAVDVVVPIINLRQAENWRVDGQASWGWAFLAVGWVATGLGWAFTTLAVAGYTGLIRKE